MTIEVEVQDQVEERAQRLAVGLMRIVSIRRLHRDRLTVRRIFPMDLHAAPPGKG
ncbi:MAG: hypothetical protein HY420_01980 [Candidatus Kerfeldbacteria bacterium]|nr:hypothetical protein [Candidatus Kerfeldbacteria bacterium]